jgi:hypothetical protein
MTMPSAQRSAALLPAVLLATLALALAPCRAGGAEAIGAEQIIDLVAAAKHISYGNPQAVALSLAGRSVAFTVSLSSLGAITAVPVAADKAVKQITVAVTTTNDGVVPNSVTVITGDDRVLGFTVTRGEHGMVAALVEGAPVSVPPPRSVLMASLGAHALSVWQLGAGSIGAAPARPGDLIGEWVPAAASATAPARVLLLTAPNSMVTLGPGAEASISTEKDAAGIHLVIALDRGAIEVSLGNKGGYRDVLVRGAAMQVRVTGALLVAERVRHDADFIALVSGHAAVGLRRAVAEALGKAGGEIELAPRQGLAVNVASGPGTVEPLASRPSVSDAGRTIHDQAASPAGGFGSDGPEALGAAASPPAGAAGGPAAGGAGR